MKVTCYEKLSQVKRDYQMLQKFGITILSK